MNTPDNISEQIREQASAWLLRLHANPKDPKLQQAFSTWLAENPLHQDAYNSVQAHWDWMDQFKHTPFPARDAALSYRKQSRKTQFAYASAAACFLALILTAFSPNGWYGSTQNYRLARGEKQSIVLADGSQIELNTDSEVRVHYNRWHRQVELLCGEAFFTVNHNPQRPFEVKAGAGKILDIGTAFEVYIQPEQVLVAVEEGIVEIETSTKKTLQAGQQISFNQNGFVENQATQNINALTAWRQGKLIFKAKALSEVLTEIGRYHDTQIKLQSPALANLKVSGTFHTDKLDNSLNAIASILPVKVEHISHREIVLKPTKAR